MTNPRRVLARALLICAALAAAGATAGIASPAAADRAVDVVVLPASQAIAALQRGDASYSVLLNQLAVLVAPRAGVDAAQLDAAWAASDVRRMTTVLSALTQLGVPYDRRAATPGEAFDCSGLTSWAWEQGGVSLPHQSRGQIGGVVQSTLDAVQPGDLLYRPGHVMLALGVGGAMIHAPHRGAVVEVRMLSDGQSRRTRVGAPLG